LLAVRYGLGDEHAEMAHQIRSQLQQELGASMEFLNQWR